ncbi:hypothetical protein GCM10029976_066430 [Kribbella albertanoniae]
MARDSETPQRPLALCGTRGLSAAPRVFVLDRHRDLSGVSGTGVVAEGVEWSDGSVALRWSGENPTTVAFETGMVGVEAVHGHGGATEVRFLDEMRRGRVPSDFEYPLSTGKRAPAASCDGLCCGCGGAWPCTRCPDALDS